MALHSLSWWVWLDVCSTDRRWPWPSSPIFTVSCNIEKCRTDMLLGNADLFSSVTHVPTLLTPCIAWHIRAKELHYFDAPNIPNNRYSKGIGFYHQHFFPYPPPQDHRLIDCTPTYLGSVDAPRRVASTYAASREAPKFVLVLRDPLDRAVSHWSHAVTMSHKHRKFGRLKHWTVSLVSCCVACPSHRFSTVSFSQTVPRVCVCVYCNVWRVTTNASHSLTRPVEIDTPTSAPYAIPVIHSLHQRHHHRSTQATFPRLQTWGLRCGTSVKTRLGLTPSEGRGSLTAHHPQCGNPAGQMDCCHAMVVLYTVAWWTNSWRTGGASSQNLHFAWCRWGIYTET